MFFRENIGKLGEENDEHMPIGFEVAFPSLLEIARGIKIDVPYDSPVLKDIYAKKELKLTRFVCWARNIQFQYSIFIYLKVYIWSNVLHSKPKQELYDNIFAYVMYID